MNSAFRGSGKLAAAIFLLCGVEPAIGQAWIGLTVGNMMAQQEQIQCMNGTPMSPAEIAEAQGPAREVMQDYWRRASAGNAADISADFHARGRAEWVMADNVRRHADLTRIQDPVARQPQSTLQGDPTGFVRAGNGATARGVWTATAANGATAGFYLADFRRVAGVWKLARLEVFASAGDAPAVTQYCARPGDVEAARERAAERKARQDQRRAAREAAEAAR